MYCLGVLRFNNWSCATRKHESGIRNKFSYEILESGTYAIIFLPDIPFADFFEDQFCGILCRNKRLVFIYVFLGIPSLLALFYLMYKM